MSYTVVTKRLIIITKCFVISKPNYNLQGIIYKQLSIKQKCDGIIHKTANYSHKHKRR